MGGSSSFFSFDEEVWCVRSPHNKLPEELSSMAPPRTLSSSSLCEIPPVERLKSSYSLREQLGKGAFGTVFAAVEEGSARVLAIKIVSVAETGSPKVSKRMHADVEQEVKMWSSIRTHPNVVGLERAYRQGIKVWMVMGECARGNLLDQGMIYWQLPEWEVAGVFREMLYGVSHVHSCRVVHRDVKPANFVYGGPEGKTVKLTDFGLAEMLPKHGRLTGTYGTPPYMSPEMAGKEGHDASTDLWSLGATYYLLFMGQYPYHIDRQDLQGRAKHSFYKQCIVENLAPPTFARVNPEATSDPLASQVVHQPSALSVQLLQSLLCRSAHGRMTAEQALHHAFLNEAEKATVAQSICGGSASEGLSSFKHATEGEDDGSDLAPRSLSDIQM